MYFYILYIKWNIMQLLKYFNRTFKISVKAFHVMEIRVLNDNCYII